MSASTIEKVDAAVCHAHRLRIRGSRRRAGHIFPLGDVVRSRRPDVFHRLGMATEEDVHMSFCVDGDGRVPVCIFAQSTVRRPHGSGP